MDIPFKVTFISYPEKIMEWANFSPSLTYALDDIKKYSYDCKELNDLRVKFECDDTEAKLWIEVMDMLPNAEFEEDEVECFLPSNRYRNIYLDSKSKDNEKGLVYTPLLPGVYRIIVTLAGSEKFYAFLNVEPLRINENQLETMRKEVEETIAGLAKGISSKKTALNFNNNSDILKKYSLLINNADSLIMNLYLILKEPKFKVEKKYRQNPVGKPLKTDLHAIRLNQVKNNKHHHKYSYSNILEYDIPLNRSLKFFLQELLNDVISVVKYLKVNISGLRAEISIQKEVYESRKKIEKEKDLLEIHLKTIKQLKYTLVNSLNQEWLKNISSNLEQQHRVHRYPYYRSIYSLYLNLRKESQYQINAFKNYIYYWKETSKIYEIWGFIKLLVMLKQSSLKFTLFKGWIFEQDSQVIYPLLTAEDIIIMENQDGLKIKLYYDTIIPKSNESEGSLENPLITNEINDRPDFRIDIYHQDMFKGSIIVDFKYRGIRKLGTPTTYINNKINSEGYKVYSQLINYSYANSYYLNRKNKSEYAFPAVQRVFGIFPLMSNQSPFFETDTGTRIIRCSLSPNVMFENIENEIITIIKDLITE